MIETSFQLGIKTNHKYKPGHFNTGEFNTLSFEVPVVWTHSRGQGHRWKKGHHFCTQGKIHFVTRDHTTVGFGPLWIWYWDIYTCTNVCFMKCRYPDTCCMLIPSSEFQSFSHFWFSSLKRHKTHKKRQIYSFIICLLIPSPSFSLYLHIRLTNHRGLMLVRFYVSKGKDNCWFISDMERHKLEVRNTFFLIWWFNGCNVRIIW